jgi:hypothetical protein
LWVFVNDTSFGFLDRAVKPIFHLSPELLSANCIEPDKVLLPTNLAWTARSELAVVKVK